nr:unnamed protein product [Spirometra erinaceieuropaei]
MNEASRSKIKNVLRHLTRRLLVHGSCPSRNAMSSPKNPLGQIAEQIRRARLKRLRFANPWPSSGIHSGPCDFETSLQIGEFHGA